MRLTKKNKRAIQLSINFIVLLILGMAMFFGGMAFVGKFFGKAQTIKGTLDTQTTKQIEAMLDSGSSFVIPIHTKEVHRTEHVTYGIGLYNDGRKPAVREFGIKITPDSAYDKNNAPICLVNECLGGEQVDDMPLFKPGYTSSQEIAVDKKHLFLFLVDIPSKTKSGTYIYNVESLQGGAPYEPALQLLVKVK
ncbi:hypothetical protein ACFL96_11750 [Thermoproteota archaeon]